MTTRQHRRSARPHESTKQPTSTAAELGEARQVFVSRLCVRGNRYQSDVRIENVSAPAITAETSPNTMKKNNG
jgi:hypothetical protein